MRAINGNDMRMLRRISKEALVAVLAIIHENYIIAFRGKKLINQTNYVRSR
jgi:hypothetical protein